MNTPYSDRGAVIIWGQVDEGLAFDEIEKEILLTDLLILHDDPNNNRCAKQSGDGVKRKDGVRAGRSRNDIA